VEDQLMTREDVRKLATTVADVVSNIVGVIRAESWMPQERSREPGMHAVLMEGARSVLGDALRERGISRTAEEGTRDEVILMVAVAFASAFISEHRHG
jgi:hypothetical protein